MLKNTVLLGSYKIDLMRQVKGRAVNSRKIT